MAAQAGKDILIKVDISGTPTAIAGLRTRQLRTSVGTIDVTNSDSSGLWRELLSGGGVKTMGVSGSGVFTDDTALNAALTAQLAGTQKAMTLVVPGLGTFTGNFQFTQIEFAGNYDGEVTFNVSLESAGAISFSAS